MPLTQKKEYLLLRALNYLKLVIPAMFYAGISSLKHEIPVSAKKRRNRNDKYELFPNLFW